MWPTLTYQFTGECFGARVPVHDEPLVKCPRCEGYGLVAMYSFSRWDPPEADDCGLCETRGQVEQHIAFHELARIADEERAMEEAAEQAELAQLEYEQMERDGLIESGLDR